LYTGPLTGGNSGSGDVYLANFEAKSGVKGGTPDLIRLSNPALQRAVQCPNCGRLLVLNENEGIVMSFVPELGVEVADEGRSSRGLFAD